jgi:hypothetical protein
MISILLLFVTLMFSLVFRWAVLLSCAIRIDITECKDFVDFLPRWCRGYTCSTMLQIHHTSPSLLFPFCTVVSIVALYVYNTLFLVNFLPQWCRGHTCSTMLQINHTSPSLLFHFCTVVSIVALHVYSTLFLHHSTLPCCFFLPMPSVNNGLKISPLLHQLLFANPSSSSSDPTRVYYFWWHLSQMQCCLV